MSVKELQKSVDIVRADVLAAKETSDLFDIIMTVIPRIPDAFSLNQNLRFYMMDKNLIDIYNIPTRHGKIVYDYYDNTFRLKMIVMGYDEYIEIPTD